MTAINVLEQFIGAGNLYVDDVLLGVTRENNVWRRIQELATPVLTGVRGPIKSTDYIVSEMAELELTLIELSAARIPLALPGALVTAQNADGIQTGGGGDTTLAALSAVGATNIKVTAVTNFAVNDVIQIGPSGLTREFRKILTVGTAGAGGTGLDLDAPLTNAHANAEVVQEVDATTMAADSAAGASNIKVASVAGLAVGNYVRIGYPSEVEVRELTFVGTAGAGGTGLNVKVPLARSHRLGDNVVEITNEGGSLIEAGTNRRLQAADYHKWELRVAGGGGREVRLGIRSGINVENTELTAEDSENPLGPRLRIQSRINDANIEESPYYIQRINPAA